MNENNPRGIYWASGITPTAKQIKDALAEVPDNFRFTGYKEFGAGGSKIQSIMFNNTDRFSDRTVDELLDEGCIYYTPILKEIT